MKHFYLTLISLLVTVSSHSQTKWNEIIQNNKTTLTYKEGRFQGEAWKKIVEEITSHNNVLIGEDHFFNEIPLFVSAVTSKIKFDNFFCEIDPYSGSLIAEKISSLSESELDKFISDYQYAFSFYALAPEFQLLEKLTREGTNIIGTDQIVLTADGLMASKLKEITKNKVAKEIYLDIDINSKEHFEKFTKGAGSPYFFTKEFTQQIAKLEALPLSAIEKEIIAGMKLSRKIYLKQDHHLRIQWMKSRVLKNIEVLHKDKNLFKYGALHLGRGESTLGGYDIGNLIANISDGSFQSSLHIMIIGKNGIQGVPFKGMQTQKVNPLSKDLKHYTPFFEASDDENWSMFDMTQIRKATVSEKIQIKDKTLHKIVNGFDYILVIPNVSPAPFMK